MAEGPSRGEKNTMVFSSALEFTGHPLSVRLALPPSLSLPFPPSPSAVTEQTGQVINSGATTLNLSCRQRFSFPPLLWCAVAQPRWDFKKHKRVTAK